jgi:hypothetical protein
LLDHRDRKLASAASGRVFVPYPLGREPLLLPLEFLFAREQCDDRVGLLDTRLDQLCQTLAAENFAGDKHQSVAADNTIDIPNQVIVLRSKRECEKNLVHVASRAIGFRSTVIPDGRPAAILPVREMMMFDFSGWSSGCWPMASFLPYPGQA